jgi:hypothetical protein
VDPTGCAAFRAGGEVPGAAGALGAAGLPGGDVVGGAGSFGAGVFREAGVLRGGVAGLAGVAGVAGVTGRTGVCGLVVVVRGPESVGVRGDEPGTAVGHATPVDAAHPMAPAGVPPTELRSGRTTLRSVVLVPR